MRYVIFILIIVVLGCDNQDRTFLQTNEVQLSNPIAELDSMIFTKSAKLEIKSSSNGSEIFYSLGKGPYQLMTNSISTNKTVEIEYFAKKEGCLNSDTLKTQAVKTKSKFSNSTIRILQSPSSKYFGLGSGSLIDLKKGNINYNKNNNWLGFQEDKIEILLDFGQIETLRNIKLSFLDDANSWIYLPTKATIITNNKIIGRALISPIGNKLNTTQVFVDIQIPRQNTSKIKIEIEPMLKIPLGLPGGGNKPWTFIDEIILN